MVMAIRNLEGCDGGWSVGQRCLDSFNRQAQHPKACYSWRCRWARLSSWAALVSRSHVIPTPLQGNCRHGVMYEIRSCFTQGGEQGSHVVVGAFPGQSYSGPTECGTLIAHFRRSHRTAFCQHMFRKTWLVAALQANTILSDQNFKG